jgi:hypothetical protein
MTQALLLSELNRLGVRPYEQSVALLWFVGREDPLISMTARQACGALEAGGLPAQNASRLATRWAADRRVAKGRVARTWRLHPRGRLELDVELAALVPRNQVIDNKSVVPSELVRARGYLARVVAQLNAAYDAELYDCCAVMCRRTLETLIIEAYEHAGLTSDIKGADGNFLMFSGLIQRLEADSRFSLGRNAMQGLRDFKRLGDLSAHNRRYNARRDDIDRERPGLRIAIEELAHLAGLNP